MSQAKTVAVIGAGVSGLTVAGALARQGFAVELFEARDRVGGCCSTTDVDGYRFNEGALYLALPQLLDRAFEAVGLHRPSVLPLTRIDKPQTARLPNGDQVTFGHDRHVSVERAHGPVDASRIDEELAHMMSRWEPALRLLADQILVEPFSFRRIVTKGWRQLPKFRGSVADELTRLFADESVRAAMSGVLLYTGIPPEQQPVISILGLVTLFSDGFHLPDGGMGEISRVLGEAVIAHGATITLNSRVEQIVVRGGQVTGVRVHDRGVVPADIVISTVSGMLTFGSLLDSADAPTRLRRKAEHARLSHSAFSVQLGLRNQIDVPSHSNLQLPFMASQADVFTPCDDGLEWLIFDAPTVTLPGLAPAGGSVVEMYPPVRRDLPLDAWNDERKEAVLDTAVAALSRSYDIDVAVSRLTSPKDFSHDLNLYRGAVYGLSPQVAPWDHFPHRTGIQGLYQCGQTTYPGYSVARSAISGVLAAREILSNGR